MPLPEHVQVRISSEAAGTISLTPVVAQTIPLRELVWIILATTGKDFTRVSEILGRGAVVQGASRFRWEPFAPAAADLYALLGAFPNPDPARAFRSDRCSVARIRVGRQVIELPRAVGSERRIFRRRSFWDALMDLARRSELRYIDYSYRTRTDEYRLALTPEGSGTFRESAKLLRYSGLAGQLRASSIEFVEFSVPFP